MRVHFDWGGPEPEVRAAMERCDTYDLEDLTVEELAELFDMLSTTLRRGMARRASAGRRHPPLGMGRLAEEAVTRRLQFRKKLAESLEIEHLFE